MLTAAHAEAARLVHGPFETARAAVEAALCRNTRTVIVNEADARRLTAMLAGGPLAGAVELTFQ
ncbi:hypothetical protein [Ottowia testudinis]|uniref:Uncharacterized protein n=1 Tax=Ottowia testudinis TaxID=2816950 RepID=A0A975CK73_9BURK|nr:hypothetical protein [Ottowia testudinis]QTD46586.1 hypothetical protein J1M35_06835 [Ottowia testudinis]